MDYSSRDELRWVELRRRTVVRNRWIDFRELTYRFPDGSIFEPYYSYSKNDYTVIVAVDMDGHFICVRQFRQGIGEVTTEFPAGGVERKDKEADSSEAFHSQTLAAAKRELREETGYVSDDWTHLITIPSDATISDNMAYVYLAKNCRKVTGQKLDETEFLNVELYTPEDLEELVKTGRFQQAVHVMAWLLAKQYAE